MPILPSARPLTRCEAQCPGCGRVFANDRVCERHKRYRADGLLCLDPAERGLVAGERRGMTVWSFPPRPAPEIRPRAGNGGDLSL